MQISAHIMDKNLAVHKTLEVIHTVHARSGTWCQHITNYT